MEYKQSSNPNYELNALDTYSSVKRKRVLINSCYWENDELILKEREDFFKKRDCSFRECTLLGNRMLFTINKSYFSCPVFWGEKCDKYPHSDIFIHRQPGLVPMTPLIDIEDVKDIFVSKTGYIYPYSKEDEVYGIQLFSFFDSKPHFVLPVKDELKLDSAELASKRSCENGYYGIINPDYIPEKYIKVFLERDKDSYHLLDEEETKSINHYQFYLIKAFGKTKLNNYFFQSEQIKFIVIVRDIFDFRKALNFIRKPSMIEVNGLDKPLDLKYRETAL
jgi:hypothetical protein